MRWTGLGCVALLAAGCLRDVPRGPELGDCAVYPDGVYSWGEVGIGTCLAGPVDVRFVEHDGRTLLAVSNADPYRAFQSGSVLLIDYDSVDLGRSTNRMHELDAWALPLTDDDDGDGRGSNAYLGQIGVLPGNRLLVPSRYTEDGVAQPSSQNELRAGLDHAYVIELGALDAFGDQVPDEVQLRDDPMPVVVDEAAGVAFVGNLTDHSLSVLTTDTVTKVDVAPGSTIGQRSLGDVGDDSFAELVMTQVLLPRDTPDDAWTLTFVDGTARVYVPTADGIVRHESGGEAFREVGFGPELNAIDDQGVPYDAFVYETSPYEDVDPLPYALFAEVVELEDGTGGAGIRRAVPDGFNAAGWILEAEPLLIGDPNGSDRVLGGPSLSVIDGISTLYYDGRETLDAASCIYAAESDDGLTYYRVRAEALVGSQACDAAVVPTDYLEVAQPYVVYDPNAGRYRMWLSAREITGEWVVALAESDDGSTWSPPRTVLALPGIDVGGPSVQVSNGRYRMFVALDDGSGWATAEADSADGSLWSEPVVVIEPTDAPFHDRPQRPGALVDGGNFWRVQGRDYGVSDVPATSGTGILNVLPGFGFAVGHGHEVSNTVVPARWAADGLTPGSAVDIDGVPTLFATATGAAGLDHVVALQPDGDTWAVVGAHDAIDDALAAPGTQATSPVVVRDAQGFVMFYGHVADGVTRIRRATSADGLTWSAETRDLLAADQDWDGQTQLPHSVETTADGVTLWYAGDNSTRFLIGAATADGLRGDFTASPGDFDPWRFGTGAPSSFDDSGVRDPLVVTIDGERRLYYSGFDGAQWHLGYAVDDGTGTFERRIGVDGLGLPALSGLPLAFSAQGVSSPVLWSTEGERYTMLFAGFDGFADRLGRATLDPAWPDAVYYDGRRPTAGDTLGFTTTRGGGGVSVIELGQTVDAFATDGVGFSSVTHDPDRGFLYVTSKLNPGITVIDIRDDSAGDFVDANYLDIETVIRPLGASAAMGFTSTQIVSDRGLLYATARTPDGLWVFDLDDVVDDDTKDDLYAAELAVLPLPDLGEDAGQRTAAFIGGAGMALSDDGDTLFVTHFRDNSLFAFDLDRGPFGESIGYVPFLGENPHVVRVAPDGRTAVVANYVGDVRDRFATSTLVIVDIDPESPTYLEPLTWIGNL